MDVFNTLADGRTNIEEIFESINKGFEKSEGGAFNVLKALVPETREGTMEIGRRLARVFKSVPATISEKWTAISSRLPDFWADIMSRFDGKGQGIADRVGKLFSPLKTVFGNLGSLFSGTTLIWVAAIGQAAARYNRKMAIIRG